MDTIRDKIKTLVDTLINKFKDHSKNVVENYQNPQNTFGFTENMNDENNESDQYQDYFDSQKSMMNMMIIYSRNFIFMIFWVFIAMAYFFMVFTAIYIAWNSVPFDPMWIKITKTYLSAIFAPFYLFYVFFKKIVLGNFGNLSNLTKNLPNNLMR